MGGKTHRALALEAATHRMASANKGSPHGWAAGALRKR
jgi:hypothetical protein